MTAANAMPYSASQSPPIIGNRPHPALTPPTATAEQLAKPHQRVLLHNTSEIQSHIIQDRYLQFHTMVPGAKVEVDMLVTAIANLHNLARTDRGYYMSGPNAGQPFPPHPVRIVDLPPIQSRPDDLAAALAQRESAIAAREAALVEKEMQLNGASKMK